MLQNHSSIEKEIPSNKAPILWALVALSYLFEIGAIAVVINTDGEMQNFAAWATMVFPIFMICAVVFIRMCKEDIFYVSIERLRDITVPDKKGESVENKVQKIKEEQKND